MYRIVVGVDGSDGGRLALRWAVHEASTRGGTVQAVTAWQCNDLDPAGADNPVELRERADRALSDEIAGLPSSGVVIAAEVVEGRAAEVLCAAAQPQSGPRSPRCRAAVDPLAERGRHDDAGCRRLG